MTSFYQEETGESQEVVEIVAIADVVTALPRSFQTTGIKIAIRHQTLSDKKCYMSATHASKQDILSCTLSLSIICGKS